MIRLVHASGHFEYFHPETGAGIGAPTFSWTAALALDLLADRWCPPTPGRLTLRTPPPARSCRAVPGMDDRVRGSVSSRSRIERSIVGRSLYERPVAPGPPWNSVSPVKTQPSAGA